MGRAIVPDDDQGLGMVGAHLLEEGDRNFRRCSAFLKKVAVPKPAPPLSLSARGTTPGRCSFCAS
jgi:hypothetical protein